MLDNTIVDRVLASSLGDSAYKACEILHDAGFESWWVGGCVRDILLEKIPKDIDICTSAKPEEIISLFPKHDNTAAKFGSIIVSISGSALEITTFRTEGGTQNSRHPESIEFTHKEEDSSRRDFTINALYYNPITKELYDPFDGQKDINEKLIRFIGDPEIRIHEDAFRMLRAVRFRSHIHGQYHPDTFKALHNLASMAEKISGSRVAEEFTKMLLGPFPEIAFEDLWETDILETLVPTLHACKGVGQPNQYHKEGDVWNHTMDILKSFTPDHAIDVRFAALFHDIGKVDTFEYKDDRISFPDHASKSAELAADICTFLQFSRRRTNKICWLISHHMMMGTFLLDLSLERRAHWYYHPWFMELLQLFFLDISGSTPSNFEMYDTIIHDYNTFLDSHPREPKPLLTGEEVMKTLSITPGEKVGQVLFLLHTKQIEGSITSKEDAITFLKHQ